MRKRMIYIISAFILTLVVQSCQMDPLYYATDEKAYVRLNVDWNKTELNPNGLTLYVFDSYTGSKVNGTRISSNPRQIDFALGVGKYNVVIHNDTEYELENINFENINSFSTFKAAVETTTESKYKSLASKATTSFSTRYTTESDILATAIVKEIEIFPTEIEYYPDKPEAGQYEIVREIDATPKRVTEIVDIQVYVKNITSAAGAPRTHLSNMAASYMMGLDRKEDDVVTHEFVLNNRQIDPENSANGTIRKELVSFGPLFLGSGFRYIPMLKMNFVLVNEEEHYVEVDLSKEITTVFDGVQNVHIIRLEVELPVVEGDHEEKPQGGFNPDIEEWENIEVDLPI